MPFEYIKSDGFIVLTDIKYIRKITFYISRYSKYKHTISFSTNVSEVFAIREVERFLSEPITEKYLNDVKDDLVEDLEWEDLDTEEYSCRGDLLTDYKFLEDLSDRGNSDVTVLCGS